MRACAVNAKLGAEVQYRDREVLYNLQRTPSEFRDLDSSPFEAL